MAITFSGGPITISGGGVVLESNVPLLGPDGLFQSLLGNGFEWTQSTGRIRWYDHTALPTGGDNLKRYIDAGTIKVGQYLSIDYYSIWNQPYGPPWVMFGQITSIDTTDYNVGGGWNIYFYVTPSINITSKIYAMYTGMKFWSTPTHL